MGKAAATYCNTHTRLALSALPEGSECVLRGSLSQQLGEVSWCQLNLRDFLDSL